MQMKHVTLKGLLSVDVLVQKKNSNNVACEDFINESEICEFALIQNLNAALQRFKNHQV